MQRGPADGSEVVVHGGADQGVGEGDDPPTHVGAWLLKEACGDRLLERGQRVGELGELRADGQWTSNSDHGGGDDQALRIRVGAGQASEHERAEVSR